MTQRVEDDSLARPGPASSDAGFAESKPSPTTGPLIIVGLALVTLVFAWTSLSPSRTDQSPDPARTPRFSGVDEVIQDAETYRRANLGAGVQLNQLEATERGWTAVYGAPQGSHLDGSLCVDFESKDGKLHADHSFNC